jgi:hypothetical protein
MNYLTRSTDKDIGLYVQYADVRQILVSRFRRRLECWDFDASPALVTWASVACHFKDWESLKCGMISAPLSQYSLKQCGGEGSLECGGSNGSDVC